MKYQYQHEIVPEDAKMCKDHYDKGEICDGTKDDCVKKGMGICLSDSNCYGIMYDATWATTYHGVKICKSWTLVEKPEKDWSVFMKCSLRKLYL